MAIAAGLRGKGHLSIQRGEPMDATQGIAHHDPPIRRFKLSVQKNRALLFTFATGVALLFWAIGVFKVSVLYILFVMAVSNLSAGALYLIYRKHWNWDLDPVWFLLDSAMVTYAVYQTGGIASPWFPWYLANVSGAAVVSGIGWAIAMSVVDLVSYVGLLLALGEIGLFDDAFFQRLALMVSLFAASSFFLWGTLEIQKKRGIIKVMKENESRKVAELTRLTAALDQRTRELAEANLRIQKADTMKSQFLANMSHELRTPLNSIIGFSEIVQSRLQGQIPEKYEGFLENINSSGQHLLGIINDLLDLSKVESGKMEILPEQFPLASVISGVCAIMKGVADKRGITLETDTPRDLPPLEADPVKVKQILYNLLSNAVKFSPDRTSVKVVSRRLDPDESPLGSESIRIDVTDRGVGIDPKFHEAIFQEFRQVDSTSTRTFGGTGLGLTLVKRFVELHGGQVTVASAPGEGSTFTVIMPVKFRGEMAAALPGEALTRNPESGALVLVVEDDPTAYEATARELVGAGLTAVRARNGEEALRMAREMKPAAITLDIILPDMDGWEILKRLKDDPETSGIPVVIVSLLDNRELGLALGAEDYFLKPIDGEAFVRRLKGLIRPYPETEVTVLLVDDDRQVHDLLDALMAHEGYPLLHAYSGREGLEMAAKRAPGLIILDLLMEGMDGFEVAARLKGAGETEEIPIMVFTAKDLTAADRHRLSGKVAAFVQKATDNPSNILQSVSGLVRRTRGRP